MTHNAKRYQFLRDRFALESSNDEAEFAKLAHLNGDEFDAALDAAMAKSGFEIAQEVEPVACLIPVLSQAADCKVNGKFYQFHYGAHHKAEILFFAAPQAVNAWQPIETAPENQLVVTTWEDKDDKELRHNFDFLEDGVWQNYFNEHEHYLIAGAARGRSEDAPYTHWMPLPGAPA